MVAAAWVPGSPVVTVPMVNVGVVTEPVAPVGPVAPVAPVGPVAPLFKSSNIIL